MKFFTPGTQAFAIILLTSVIAMTGCQKIVDYIHHPGNGDADFKACALEKISVATGPESGFGTVNYIFTYNKSGDPVTVKNNAVATGNPNLWFVYGKSGRLLQFIRPYENGAYESWEKYGYNKKNQIVRDTGYAFGLVIDSVPVVSNGSYRYTDFTYDLENRVISRTDSSFYENTLLNVTNTSFSYDKRGDLVIPGAVYDNGVNLLRTNKIWMFITCNYSINNAFKASAYNDHDFPVSFPSSYETLSVVAPMAGDVTVEYACK